MPAFNCTWGNCKPKTAMLVRERAEYAETGKS